MRCPHCGASESRVVESREGGNQAAVRRRRECIACKTRFTTYERIEPRRLLVVKKSGVRVPYERTKLANGIYRACEKRPLEAGLIESTIDGVEREIMATQGEEIQSQEVGQLVMNCLAQLDEVAYVRFASVYRSFSTIESFEEAIKSMKRTQNRP